MGLEKYNLRLTDHAHEQYCRRVHVIRSDDLRERIAVDLQASEYYRKDEYLKIDDVWWVYAIKDEDLVMITCYGRSNFDLPAAKRWAQRHNDRIDLTGGEVLCDGEGQVPRLADG